MAPELEPNVERFVPATVALRHQSPELVSQSSDLGLELPRILIYASRSLAHCISFLSDLRVSANGVVTRRCQLMYATRAAMTRSPPATARAASQSGITRARTNTTASSSMLTAASPATRVTAKPLTTPSSALRSALISFRASSTSFFTRSDARSEISRRSPRVDNVSARLVRAVVIGVAAAPRTVVSRSMSSSMSPSCGAAGFRSCGSPRRAHPSYRVGYDAQGPTGDCRGLEDEGQGHDSDTCKPVASGHAVGLRRRPLQLIGRRRGPDCVQSDRPGLCLRSQWRCLAGAGSCRLVSPMPGGPLAMCNSD